MKGKVKKAVIVKFKGAHTHNHNSTEQLKTEMRQKLNASRDNRQKTASSHLHSYVDIYGEESKDISRPSKIIDTSMNDSNGKKHMPKNSESKEKKDKIPSLKNKAQNKQNRNPKKAVNFGKNPMNTQKSERNLDKNRKDNESNISSVKKKQLPDKNNKRKQNKSMMNFNNKMLKNTNSDNDEESLEKLNNENKTKKNEQKPVYRLDFKEMNYQGEIVKKPTVKKEKTNEPSLKIKTNEEIIVTKPILTEHKEIIKPEMSNNYENNEKEEIIQENKPNDEDDANKLEIIEVKNDIAQYKKEDDNDNDNNNDNNDNNYNNNYNDNNKMINVENYDDNKDNNNNPDNNYKNLDMNENAPLQKNSINNIDINIPKNIKVPDSNKKPDSINNSPEKTIKKDQKKKDRAYSNFIQNIKKANKKKKGGKIANLLRIEDPRTKHEDPKAKLSRAIKKLSMLNRTIIHTYKGINSKEKSLNKTLNPNPLSSSMREDILNTKEEMEHETKNLSTKNVINNSAYENYTGIILLKYEEGEKITEIKWEGDIEDINDLFMKNNIEINDEKVELVYKDELKNLKKAYNKLEKEYSRLKEEFERQVGYNQDLREEYNYQNEQINKYEKERKEYDKQKQLIIQYENERREYLKQKELINKYENEKQEYIKQKDLLIQYENERKERKEDPLKASIRKKAKEKQNVQMEEDRIKIQEMKDRIQKYKDELKGNSPFNFNRMSCRVKFKKKPTFNLDDMMDSNLLKLHKIEEEKDNKNEHENDDLYENVETPRETKEVTNTVILNKNTFNDSTKINNNNNNNNSINNDNNISRPKNVQFKDEKKTNNIVTFKEPDKDKSKSYSRAMDRFKKRFKKDTNKDYSSKKSEKINEMAKKLENVMGRPQSAETRDRPDKPEIEMEGKTAEILQSQTLSVKKVKKPHRPHI